jgi:hypothetical protein
MMEQMNALIAAQGGRKSPADKENTPPLKNGSKKNEQDIKPRGPRRLQPRDDARGIALCLCPHCKALVYHKANKCYELESNKDKR